MTVPEFSCGDAVQLSGAGPVMHVIALHPPARAAPPLYYCNWLDPSGVLCHGTFEQHHLTRVAQAAAGAAAAD